MIHNKKIHYTKYELYKNYYLYPLTYSGILNKIEINDVIKIPNYNGFQYFIATKIKN